MSESQTKAPGIFKIGGALHCAHCWCVYAETNAIEHIPGGRAKCPKCNAKFDAKEVAMFLDGKSLTTEPEKVNHPAHYGGDTPYECIKVLDQWLTPQESLGFLKGNAIKYLSRAGKKEGATMAQDIAKAHWYTERLKAFIETHPNL